MNTFSLCTTAAQIPAYLALQREMQEALLAQHPEWIEHDGTSPTCDEYDRRLAQLLTLFSAVEHFHAHSV
ncbi:MAG TPA: hypothetical protein VIU85_01575 [Chthoniobacterales bacterium]